MMNFSVYLAGPFFNPMQIHKMDVVKNILKEAGIEVLDPREIGPVIQNIPKEDRTEDLYQQIFEGNVAAIAEADVTLACIDEKDSGTAFEIGLAFAKRGRNGVVTFSLNDANVNVMLGRAASIHLRSLSDIKEWAHAFKNLKDFSFENFNSQGIDE